MTGGEGEGERERSRILEGSSLPSACHLLYVHPLIVFFIDDYIRALVDASQVPLSSFDQSRRERAATQRDARRRKGKARIISKISIVPRDLWAVMLFMYSL